ncbi:MAG TPA: hypothetical protein VFW64_12310 [Pseudonocardiaceae bacterium]|nr:hypothetical protein [Pseudonocardiaceae bacterium]
MRPAYGRYQVAEPLSALLRTHVHDGRPLREVDWEPKVGVLDQSDLLAQSIRCSEFIPGATDPDALGSCTANGTTSALSNLLDEQDFLNLVGAPTYADVVAAEKWAISFYHQCSDQTGDPSQEWPPTDCGSSGPYIVSELKALNLAAGDRIAHGADSIVSLMQDGGLLIGSPWLNDWEEPNSAGFIDGDGSVATLQQQIKDGVAGGHETFLSAVERLALTETGRVIPERTVLRGRNSWSARWGDHGSYRVYLSTLVALGQYCDFRLLVAR